MFSVSGLCFMKYRLLLALFHETGIDALKAMKRCGLTREDLGSSRSLGKIRKPARALRPQFEPTMCHRSPSPSPSGTEFSNTN